MPATVNELKKQNTKSPKPTGEPIAEPTSEPVFATMNRGASDLHQIRRALHRIYR
jgi:hypothetical protein